MISMSWWGWGGNPVFGWMTSSFQTRRAPQFMRAGSWYPEKEK